MPASTCAAAASSAWANRRPTASRCCTRWRRLPQHPESVPINQLVQVPGTPLHGLPELDPLEFVRAIATARLLMPNSYVRLSAGRTDMSDAVQALCFLAGANSIFYGDRLLTTPNPGRSHDEQLFERLGIVPEQAAGRRRLSAATRRCRAQTQGSPRNSRRRRLPDGRAGGARSRRASRAACACPSTGRECIAFCSNDYLGLADHPRVVEAFCAAARAWGVGSGARTS